MARGRSRPTCSPLSTESWRCSLRRAYSEPCAAGADVGASGRPESVLGRPRISRIVARAVRHRHASLLPCRSRAPIRSVPHRLPRAAVGTRRHRVAGGDGDRPRIPPPADAEAGQGITPGLAEYPKLEGHLHWEAVHPSLHPPSPEQVQQIITGFQSDASSDLDFIDTVRPVTFEDRRASC